MASKTNYKSKYWMATEGIIQDQYVSLTCLWLIINSLNFSQFFRLVVIMHTAVQIRDMHPYYCKPKDMWKYLFTLWKSYMNYTHKIQTGVKEKKTDAIRLEPISTSSLHPSFPLPLFGYLHCQIYRVSFVVFKKNFFAHCINLLGFKSQECYLQHLMTDYYDNGCPDMEFPQHLAVKLSQSLFQTKTSITVNYSLQCNKKTRTQKQL